MLFDKDKQELLRKLVYEIIKEEQLPNLDMLKFQYSLKGSRHRNGYITRSLNHRTENTLFKITVNLVKAKYVEHSKGQYIDRVSKKRLVKLDIGEEIGINEIIHILCHEIAHMKYWHHNIKHKIYTNQLIGKLKNKIETGEIKTQLPIILEINNHMEVIE